MRVPRGILCGYRRWENVVRATLDDSFHHVKVYSWTWWGTKKKKRCVSTAGEVGSRPITRFCHRWFSNDVTWHRVTPHNNKFSFTISVCLVPNGQVRAVKEQCGQCRRMLNLSFAWNPNNLPSICYGTIMHHQILKGIHHSTSLSEHFFFH